MCQISILRIVYQAADNSMEGVYYVAITTNILAGLLFFFFFVGVTYIGVSCMDQDEIMFGLRSTLLSEDGLNYKRWSQYSHIAFPSLRFC
jgi:hypothetical protein